MIIHDAKKRVEVALKILELWYVEIAHRRPMHRRAALRWKTIGIVQHDRILNNEPAPPIPLRTMSQVAGK